MDSTGTGYCEECNYKCGTCYGANNDNCLSCDKNLFRELIIVNSSVSP